MSWDTVYNEVYGYTVATGLKETLNLIEAGMIARALAEANGNCSAAAKLLGIGRTLLVEKRRKYGFALKPQNVSHAPVPLPEVETVEADIGE